jgi:hypothetical protein
MGKIIKKGIEYSGSGASKAVKVPYDNTLSQLDATNVQSAIDEVSKEMNNKVDTTDSRLTDARTPKEHNHDDRYYTETEIDSKFSTTNQNVTNNTNAINQLNSDLNEIGTVVIGSTLSTAAKKTWAANRKISLPKGKWIVSARCIFASDNTGYRAINIATNNADSTAQCSVQAVNGTGTGLSTTIFADLENDATYYLNVVHSSTNNTELSITSDLRAIRVK